MFKYSKNILDKKNCNEIKKEFIFDKIMNL